MQKRLLLSLVLSIGFMFLWTQLGQRMGYYEETQTENTPVSEEGGTGPLSEASESTAEESSQPYGGEASDVVPAEEPLVVIERRSDILENNAIRVVFDNLGAHLYDVVLHKVYQTSKKLDPVRLMKPGTNHPGTLVFDDQSTDKEWLYQVDASADRIVYTGTRGSATVSKTFSLGQGYQLNCEVSYDGAASQNFMMVVAEGLQPVGADEKLKPSLLSMGAINPKMMQFAWSEGGSHESEQVGKPEKGARFEPELEEEALIEWLGVKDNYFANVFLPNTPVTNIYTKSLNTFPGQEPITLPVVAIRAQGSLGGKFYLGPMIEEDLKAADPRLENLITFGWAGLLSKWLLAGLIMAHSITNNWGWAIVVLTLFIRALMIPLTIPSVKSSFKMRKIQPKIEKLKEKFSGTDMETKQKLSQATFALYKTEGVNPFSSCLTALAQMPVFFAYFSLLRSSSSLRQAEWMGWITDLSVRDSTFVLPIVMGATMFLSTLAMPMPTADPMQAKMMKFMPLIFSFMFINMPAGLILYMITSNLFTLGQTKFLQRRYAQNE